MPLSNGDFWTGKFERYYLTFSSPLPIFFLTSFVYCHCNIFLQTVNEALASQVRIVLPSVPVFVEAYSDTMPQDAFWEPLNRTSMVNAIQIQLDRHAVGDPIGVPDVSKLKTWDEACEALLDEYNLAANDKRDLFGALESLWFPIWLCITIFAATTFFIFSQIRSALGGSIRLFFRNTTKDLLIQIKSSVSILTEEKRVESVLFY